MLDYDRSNFLSFILNFPEQLKEAPHILQNTQFRVQVDKIRTIVYSGMGGSAIAGDLLFGYISDELPFPFYVNREYSIPAYVDEHTLFIASSYSGNTEETLTATQKAFEKGAQVIGVSSGGQLGEVLQEKASGWIRIPEGLPPRQALGYLFFPLWLQFQKWGFIPDKTGESEETYAILLELRKRFNPQASHGRNLPNHIAQTLYHTIPVIYTAVPFLYPVVTRWRNQMNENAKIMAFSNVFPELNHNEIMGWEGPPEVNRLFRVILLRDKGESPRNKQRVEITKSIFKSRRVQVLEIFAEGQSRLARLFSLIYIGDWVSYYLAMIHEKDPIEIGSINLLKKKLSEFK